MILLKKIIPKFKATFWISNVVELFERWAWYGVFAVLSLYLVNSTDEGALGLSQTEKGWIMGIGSMILYFLPVITGSIADKVGYKKVMLVSFAIYAVSFITMPLFKGFYGVFICFLFLALGGALFKPLVSATVSKTTDDTNSSIGFGIFYMMVNIGAFIAPFFSSKLRPISWNYVFYLSTVIVIMSFFLVLIFYKEPEREKNTDSVKQTIKKIFTNVLVALSDLKFVIFLLLIAGFWTMYFQLFFTLPTFIEQWVDTTTAYNALASVSPALAEKIGTENGTILPELLINVDAMYIILFQVIVSAIVMKFRPLHAMMAGILVGSVGMGLALMTQNGLFIVVALFVFALGEMSSSPKTNEYVGKIAPKDKVALYMGCNFLPLAAGNFFAGIISGNVYENMSDKISLLRREIGERGLKIPELSDNFSKNDMINMFSEKTGMHPNEITQLLWDKYEPSNIWMVVTSIGVIAAIGLFIYDKIFFSDIVNAKQA